MVVPNRDETVYPSSDGKPMAENTEQYRWIVTIKGGMDVVFKDRPDVFVAGDLLWYPVQYHPEINAAPDTMVAIGRPKGDRLSYLQWREGDQPPQVVFEVMSPSNTTAEMADKLDWYERYGVQEYYIYDPDRNTLQCYVRKNDILVGVYGMRHGFTSPLTGVTLKLEDELVLAGPDGKAFREYLEWAERSEWFEKLAEEQRRLAEQARERGEQERQRAELERERATQERQRTDRLELQANEERQRIEQERQAAQNELARLLARLKKMGIDPATHSLEESGPPA